MADNKTDEVKTDIKTVSAKVDVELWNRVLDKAFPEIHDIRASKIIPMVLRAYIGE